jgi:hypothetical protein
MRTLSFRKIQRYQVNVYQPLIPAFDPARIVAVPGMPERLVKELRLAGMSTIEETCHFLLETHLPRMNGKLSRPRDRVRVKIRLDGSYSICFKGKALLEEVWPLQTKSWKRFSRTTTAPMTFTVHKGS